MGRPAWADGPGLAWLVLVDLSWPDGLGLAQREFSLRRGGPIFLCFSSTFYHTLYLS
jgi:hypothetical protein